jgi:hypothetical protein
MAYIEENMQKRRGAPADAGPAGPADPYAELHALPARYTRLAAKGAAEEGSVAGSLAMLTAIPEVDLGMEYAAPLRARGRALTHTQHAAEEHRGDGAREGGRVRRAPRAPCTGRGRRRAVPLCAPFLAPRTLTR